MTDNDKPHNSIQTMDEDHDEDEETVAMDVDAANPIAGLDSKALEVLKGSVENLPRLPTKTVRIFLSSTFSDFKAERNILPKLAYPDLLSYCSELGLEFQVVDMRWGVTDDAINDHQVSALCLQEIMTCQQVSCGPNFVVLLGNRYGWQPFPATVEAKMFEEFLKIAEEKDLPQWQLLLNWFIRDDNAVPPQFNLQPIHKYLKYYSDMNQDSLRERDRAQWRQVFIRLRTLLRECATVARQRNIIEADEEKKFYISVTEEEMGQGVFASERPEQQILCYMRDLNGIEENYPQSELFIDVDERGSIDAFAQGLRRELHQKKIPMVLPDSNIKRYKVNWTGVHLEDSKDFEHQTYLERFCADFVQEMKNLINSAYEDYEDEDHQLVTTIFHEALHHARFAKVKCEVFCGRDDELKFIQKYLQDPREKHNRSYPFVIYGKSGIGKTALLAKAAYYCPQWLGPSAVTILRFFGTSPQSSNISDALKSMIYQICINFGYKLPKEETLENFGDIRREFWELLERTGQEKVFRPLVLILDSVDQLMSSYGAHHMIWLPKAIPRNVYLITAMLSERFGCLESSRKRFMNCPNFLELDFISTETGSEIIDVCLDQANRNLTAEQRQLVKQVFEKNPQPLFLKLLMDNARTWHSYTLVTANELGSTVHGAITRLFEQLELKYGRTFVRHALGYLTCGRVGLTDVEMEDALSCDDKVLVEVYQYHDPPLEGMIRIPPLLWARLQNALKEYLADRQVDGKVVQAWYHRQFWEAAEQRYLSTSEEIEARHGVLAEIFLQESGVCRTIILEQRAGKVIENAKRCVTPQPLSARNKRKLNSLPYHFICGNRIGDLKERCLLNFEWLLIKLLSVNISMVTKEYTLMCEREALKGHADVELFRNFLDLCFDSLWHDPYLLAYHVKERLSRCTDKSALLDKMVRDATTWLNNTHIPTLVPTHVLNLASPDSPLRFNILVGYDGILSKDEVMMACHWSEINCPAKIQVLNLMTKDIVASVQTERKVPFALTSDSRFFIFCDSFHLKVCELDGGDIVNTFPYFNGEYDKISVRSMALNRTSKMVAVSVKMGRPKDLTPFQRWESKSMLYLIDLQRKQTQETFTLTGRTVINQIFFTPDDKHVISLMKDRIFIHDIQNLEEYESCDQLGDIHTNLFSLLDEADTLVGPVTVKGSVKLLLMNCSRNEITISHDLHGDHGFQPFYVKSKKDGSCHLVGLTSRLTCMLCTWDTKTEEIKRIGISMQGSKGPNVLTVTSDWCHVFVGWNSGHISIVDLTNEQELHAVQSHGQAVNYMQMLSNSFLMITISQDHSFKMWDTSRWLALAHTAWEQKKTVETCSVSVSQAPYLDQNEQCLDVVTTGSVVVTAPKDTICGPRCWSTENGELLNECTGTLQELYGSSMKSKAISLQEGPTHAELDLINDEMLVYTRRRRDCMAVCVFDSVENPKICGHKMFNYAFLSMIPHGELFGKVDPMMYVVEEGKLSIHSLPSLEEHSSIPIPSIIGDVGMVSTNGGRRRLGNYRVGITVDTKYFLIVNPAGAFGCRDDRYFDLIDLQSKSSLCRVKFPKRISATLMENSITFLVEGGEKDWSIYPPSKLEEVLINRECSYRLIYNGRFLSKDGSLGVEFCNRYHSCNVWQINPLKRIHILTNHTHQLTCCDFSTDNQYLVTGSYDKTVRVWSLATGAQLCMFHTNGSAVQVFFNSPGTYVIVSCYAAPQKKRTIILKFQNSTGKRKLSRFISKYDLM